MKKTEEEKRYEQKLREEYEEFLKIPSLWGWITLFIVSGVILGWGMLIMYLIPDRPRFWDYGSFDETPAASIYSTELPPRTVVDVPPQIAPPPEAKKREDKPEIIEFP